MLSKFAVPSLLFCSVLGGVAMFPHDGEFGVSPNGEPWDCQNIPNIITLPSPSETDFTDPYVIDKYNEIWHCHMLEVNEKAADLKKLIVRGDRSGFIYANDPSNLNIDPDLVLQLVTWAVFDANIRVFGWKGYEKWVRDITYLLLQRALQNTIDESVIEIPGGRRDYLCRGTCSLTLLGYNKAQKLTRIVASQ